jgi:hypothetical protein
MRNLLLIFIVLLTIVSCKEDESIIGLELQENRFTVHYDTVRTIKTFTKWADSLSLTGASTGLLGDYSDPVFGRTRAAIAMQVVPKASVINLGSSPVADSIVLKLIERSGFYGLDSAAIHTVRVYRVNTGMSLDDLDSTVVNFSTLNSYKGALLAERQIMFDTNDPIPFEIKFLDNTLATALLQDTSYYKNDSLFKTYFSGLIIEAEKTSANGSIITIDFSQTQTHMRLHFKNATDTLYFDFVLKGDKTKRYSIFDHEYAPTPVQTALNDTTFQSMSFLQGMNGVGIKIRIDGLDTLFTDDKWAVNSAQLVIKLATESDTANYLPPASIIVKMVKDGEEVFTPDYRTTGGTTTSPENYNIGINGYNIRLNKLLYEALINRQTSITLTAYATSPLTKANRAVLAGPDHPNDTLRPVLHIIRSK